MLEPRGTHLSLFPPGDPSLDAMAEAEAWKLLPPLPPRLDWFVHTQADQLAQGGIPEWFHGTITRQ